MIPSATQHKNWILAEPQYSHDRYSLSVTALGIWILDRKHCSVRMANVGRDGKVPRGTAAPWSIEQTDAAGEVKGDGRSEPLSRPMGPSDSSI